MTLKIYPWVLIAILTSCLGSQKINTSQDVLWRFIPKNEIAPNNSLPLEYHALILNTILLDSILREDETPELTLPYIDKNFINVKLEKSGTMSDELATKFPNIKSFTGTEIGNDYTTLRIDKNLSGLYVMLQKNGKTFFINPVRKGGSNYIIYDKEFAINGGNPFFENETNKR